jgi:hypothetical protein
MQLERNALEGAMVARNAEVEHLKADNARYASEWECREKSLVGSHELRIQHLLGDLTAKDKHNSELHNSLHKATVELQTYKADLHSCQSQLQVRQCITQSCCPGLCGCNCAVMTLQLTFAISNT